MGNSLHVYHSQNTTKTSYSYHLYTNCSNLKSMNIRPTQNDGYLQSYELSINGRNSVQNTDADIVDQDCQVFRLASVLPSPREVPQYSKLDIMAAAQIYMLLYIQCYDLQITRQST